MKNMIVLLTVFLSVSAQAGQQFKTGSSVPMPELIQDLEETFKKEIKDKNVEKITIEGHTDQRGSEEMNLRLSQRRAMSAANELIALGADKNKITAIGKGESDLLDKGVTDLAHSTNRRVVVIVKSDSGTSVIVISENKEKKCEEKVTERVVEKEVYKKNMLIAGVSHDYTGLDTEINGNTASIQSRKNAVIDIGYMRKRIFDTPIGLGLSINTNSAPRIFAGYEF